MNICSQCYTIIIYFNSLYYRSGADINARDKKGRTPLDLAMEGAGNVYTTISEKDHRERCEIVIDVLVQEGAVRGNVKMSV